MGKLGGVVALCCGLWIQAADAQTAPPVPPAPHPPAKVRIGIWDNKTDPMVRIAEPVVRRAYAELKQPMDLVDLPIRRAFAMMLKGDLDGNVLRIAEVAQEQPTLYRVEAPLVTAEVRVYARPGSPQPTQWSGLNGLRVAYMRGVLVLERNIPNGGVRVEADTAAEVLRMVNAGIADVGLMTEPAQAKPYAGAKTYGLVRQDAVLLQYPLHHYLIGSQRELGLRLNAVLKKLEASGELQAIRAKALAAFE